VIGCRIHQLDEVDSTQSVLSELARDGAPEGTVVTARHQTGGRGRRGRRWWDEPGQSLLMSVLLRPRVPPSRVPQLSLLGGLAMIDALLAAAGVTARIRWPNDVLVGQRKVCGILSEASSGRDGQVEHVIVGIGLNIDQARFPDELLPVASSLRLATGRSHDHARVLECVLAALDRRYAEWLGGGFAGLRTVWREHSLTIGARVPLPGGGDGVAVDVDADGALLVDAGDGALRRLVSAEPAAAR